MKGKKAKSREEMREVHTCGLSWTMLGSTIVQDEEELGMLVPPSVGSLKGRVGDV